MATGNVYQSVETDRQKQTNTQTLMTVVCNSTGGKMKMNQDYHTMHQMEYLRYK